MNEKRPRHNCETEIRRDLPGRRLASCCFALAKGSSRSKIGDLVSEGLPHDILSVGPHGRVTRRFNLAECDKWLRGRRVRQLTATLDGHRYERRTGMSP